MTYDRARLIGRRFDRERQRTLGEGARLEFFEKRGGQPDEPLLTITDGWRVLTERVRGQVETLLRIEVTERDEITPELIARVDRVRSSGMLCGDITFDSPVTEPVWTIFGREIKQGGVKR